MKRSRRFVAVILAYALFAVAVSCQPKVDQAAADRAAAAKAAVDSAMTAQAVQRGQHLFLAYCAMCHGDGGAGDGEVAERFSRENVKVAHLNDADKLGLLKRIDLEKVIREGGGHTQRSNLMPPWGNRLTPQEISDVTEFVMQLPYMNPAVPAATLAKYMAAPPGVPADGRSLFVHHCVACHGSEGKGDGPFAKQLATTSKVVVRNLTDTEYFKGRRDSDLFATVSLGGGHFKKAVQMPAWTQTLTPAQMKSLVAYVRSISNTPSQP